MNYIRRVFATWKLQEHKYIQEYLQVTNYDWISDRRINRPELSHSYNSC
jgi:hypothetical protein